jgi:hypothetical protein
MLHLGFLLKRAIHDRLDTEAMKRVQFRLTVAEKAEEKRHGPKDRHHERSWGLHRPARFFVKVKDPAKLGTQFKIMISLLEHSDARGTSISNHKDSLSSVHLPNIWFSANKTASFPEACSYSFPGNILSTYYQGLIVRRGDERECDEEMRKARHEMAKLL